MGKTRKSKPKDRDGNILKSYTREINLQTKVNKDEKKYSRKQKYREFN